MSFRVNLMIFEYFKREGNQIKGNTTGESMGSTGSKKKKDDDGTNTPESGVERLHKNKSRASPGAEVRKMFLTKTFFKEFIMNILKNNIMIRHVE